MTSQQVARKLAREIRDAVEHDVLMESLNFSGDDQDVETTSTWAKVEEVRLYLRSLRIGQQPIMRSKVHELLRLTGEELGLDDPELMLTLDESFSSKAYMQMVANISNLIRQVKRK